MSPREAALRTFVRNFLSLTVVTLAVAMTSLLLARDAAVDRHIEASADAVTIAAAVTGLPAAPSPDTVERLGVELLVGLDARRVTVFDADGSVQAQFGYIDGDASRYARPPEFLQAARGGTGVHIRRDNPEAPTLIHVARAIQRVDGSPAYVVSVSQTRAVVLSSIFAMLVTVGYVLVALLSAAGLYLRHAARGYEASMTAIMEAANFYGQEELSHRAQLDLPASGFPDIARRLNEMASSLSRRFDEVRTERDLFETILANMIEGVILLDEHGHIRLLNHAARELFATADTGAEGKSLVELTRNAEIDEFARATLQTDHALERTVAIYDREIVYLQLHGSALLDATGSPAGAVIVVSDVSRLKRLENVRTDFVANVSHELKTPITSVIGFVETLREDAFDDPAQARRFLDIIADHAQRLNLIIDDLLSLSRLESRQEEVARQEINIGDLVDAVMEACRPQAEGKSVRLYRECECSSDAYVNQSLLQQAITNLVDNAVKYSESGSAVGIEITRSEEELLIAVEDTGPGIPRRDLPRIFERFYRVDRARSRALGGTGLGLSIVKHIAQAHGGSVEVESELGRGSRFTIRLPQ